MTVIKINAITVPEDSGDQLAKRFAARAGSVDGTDGFEGFELLQPSDERTTWLVITRWRDEESFDAWRSGESFGRSHGKHSAGDEGSPKYSDAPESEDSGAGRPLGIKAELWSYTTAVTNP